MLSNILLAIGVICLLIGLLAIVGVLNAPGTVLIVVAIICLVAGYFLRGTHRAPL